MALLENFAQVVVENKLAILVFTQGLSVFVVLNWESVAVFRGGFVVCGLPEKLELVVDDYFALSVLGQNLVFRIVDHWLGLVSRIIDHLYSVWVVVDDSVVVIFLELDQFICLDLHLVLSLTPSIFWLVQIILDDDVVLRKQGLSEQIVFEGSLVGVVLDQEVVIVLFPRGSVFGEFLNDGIAELVSLHQGFVLVIILVEPGLVLRQLTPVFVVPNQVAIHVSAEFVPVFGVGVERAVAFQFQLILELVVLLDTTLCGSLWFSVSLHQLSLPSPTSLVVAQFSIVLEHLLLSYMLNEVVCLLLWLARNSL